MVTITFVLALACALLAYLLIVVEKKNAKLVVPRQDAGGDPLTVDSIIEAVKYAGYVPEKNETWIRFMVSGEPYIIFTDQLPHIFVVRDYRVDTDKWEIDQFKHAAHLMSDDMVMVKAVFFEDAKRCDLRFFVDAMDRNYASFKENLPSYINYIQEGQRRMNEFYQNLVKEKEEAALTLNPIFPLIHPEKKIMS